MQLHRSHKDEPVLSELSIEPATKQSFNEMVAE